MNKIKTVKIKNLDGSVSEESYTIAVDARNVDMENGKELQETIGTIDIDNDGDVSNQLKDLKKNKINKTDIIDNLESNDNDKVLSANQGKIINDKLNKKTYYFNNVAEMKEAKLKAGDFAITLGYYEANDGGGATYHIREKQESDVIDNGSFHLLDNNLVAELISKDIYVEMFGAKGDGKTDDTDSFVNAINKFDNINLLKKTYKLTNLIINKDLIINGNDAILIDSVEVEHFIEMNNSTTAKKLTLNNINIDCPNSNVGIYVNKNGLHCSKIKVKRAIDKCIHIVKADAYGECNIDYVRCQLSNIGIQLDATDCFISNYYGYNLMTHLVNNGGINHVNVMHGWNYNTETKDWITGTILIDTTADIIGNDIYCDTLESIIKVPNGHQYTSILLQNVNYFLNTSSYPTSQNIPEIIQNYENYTGYCKIDGLILNANGWTNSEGLYPKIKNYPRKISLNNVTTAGWYCYNYNPEGITADFNLNQLTVQSSYVNSGTRKYIRNGYKTHIYMIWNLRTSIPDNIEILNLDFNNVENLYPLFNNITKYNSTMKAIFRSTSNVGLSYDLSISKTGDKIYVYNTTGKTLGNEGNYGEIEIYIDYDKID